MPLIHESGVRVDPSSSDRELGLDHISETLRKWFQRLHSADIRFTENTSPDTDPHSRYTVAYEAIFQPSDLNKARLELWVTRDGAIATGLETKGRIAERLGKKVTSDKIFAAGHEPYPLSKPGLLALLTMVSEGRIGILATCVPFFGLVSTKAVLIPETDQYLSAHCYDHRSWLNVVATFESPAFAQVLTFNRW